jgi:hypothetical protein
VAVVLADTSTVVSAWAFVALAYPDPEPVAVHAAKAMLPTSIAPAMDAPMLSFLETFIQLLLGFRADMQPAT